LAFLSAARADFFGLNWEVGQQPTHLGLVIQAELSWPLSVLHRKELNRLKKCIVEMKILKHNYHDPQKHSNLIIIIAIVFGII